MPRRSLRKTYKKRTYKRKTYKLRPVKRVYKRTGMSARQKYQFASTHHALQSAMQRVSELESIMAEETRSRSSSNSVVRNLMGDMEF